jgi:hypothetical protein
VGALGFIMGSVGLAAQSEDEDICEANPEAPECDTDPLAPVGLMVGGAAALMGGVVMTAVGAQSVQIVEPRYGSLAPDVIVAGSQVRLRWRF